MRSSVSHRISHLTGCSYKNTLAVLKWTYWRAVSNPKCCSKALIPIIFWVLCLAYEEGRHICPRVSLLTLQKAIPSISKIKQVCKRDPRSMNAHQPRHLAPVCFLSKWSWLLSRVANGIEINWVCSCCTWPSEFLQRNTYNNRYWNSPRCNSFSAQVYQHNNR